MNIYIYCKYNYIRVIIHVGVCIYIYTVNIVFVPQVCVNPYLHMCQCKYICPVYIYIYLYISLPIQICIYIYILKRNKRSPNKAPHPKLFFATEPKPGKVCIYRTATYIFPPQLKHKHRIRYNQHNVYIV